MKTRYLIMGIGGFVAFGLYMNKPKGDTKEWNEGYAAGWLTPGPGSILLLTGLLAFNA